MASKWLQPFGAGGHLRAVLAPEHAGARGRWLEVILIPLLAVGMGWYWNPQDPLLLHTAFPWLWFGPVLVSLRYGVMSGLASGFILLGSWVLGNALGDTAFVGTDFPRDYFFGGGLLILLSGEFSDVWRDRIARMDETNIYVTERLSRLTKRHLLLNISHDRMEQEMLARPGSLRDALANLRNVVLMAENIKENAGQLGRFKRAERGRTGAKQIKRGQEIPIAVLVKRVDLKRRLNLAGGVQRSLPALARAIQQELDKV